MSDNPLRKPIHENFSQKETDEIIQIWQENNRHEWSDLTFEVIQQILQERGVEIPPQNDPQFELEPEQDAEEVESEKQLPPDNQPVFYKPQQLIFFADAASVAAWVTLATYIVIGLWYFFSNWDNFSDARILVGGIMSFFSRIVTGVISFILLKGVSFALQVLMEFEFNSRGVK